MQKLKYQRFRVGKFAILKDDETHDGRKIPKGTMIKILSFPFKVTKSNQDDGYKHKNRNGTYWVIYDRIIHGITQEGYHVRPYISNVIRTRKSFKP